MAQVNAAGGRINFRLEVENLTSFRGKQPVLDLRELELFAIAGPTGSGKSSLLDAMVFALYGQIPRVDKKDCADMISLGNDRLSVRFDFRLGKRSYRVVRVLRRGRPTDGQIEDISDAEPRTITEGVKGVNEEVQRLIGLDFVAFTRCVILPQGEFARFLKSKPGERRDILSKLLRLTIYEEMRRKASKDADALQTQIDTTRGVQQQQLAEATPEAVSALEHERAGLAAEITVSAGKLKSEEAALEALRHRNQRTRELRQHRGALAALDERGNEIERSDARVTNANRAAAVVPLLDVADRAADKAKRDAAEADSAAKALHAAEERHEQAKMRLADSQKHAAEIPTIEQRLRQLEGAIALLQPLASARRRATDAKKALDDHEAELQRVEKDAEGARREATQLAAEAARLRQALDSVAYDPGRHRQLEALGSRVSAISTERAAVKRSAERVRTATVTHRRTTGEADARKRTSAAAAETLQSSEKALRAAEEALEAARREDMAAHLRRELHTGAPCPVCDQAVRLLPPALAVPTLDRLETEVLAARNAATAARTEATTAHTAAAHASAAAETAERALAEATADDTAAHERLTELLAALVSDAVAHLDLRNIEQPEITLTAALTALASARQTHEAALSASNDAQARLSKAQSDAEKKQQHAELLGQASQRLRDALQEGKSAARLLEEQLAACGTDDPAAERNSAAARKQCIEKECDSARSEEAEAARLRAGAEATASQTRRAAQEAAHAAEDANEAAHGGLRDSGFTSAGDARKAHLAKEALHELVNAIETHKRQRHAHASRVTELEKVLGGDEVEDDTVERLASEVAEHRRRHEKSVGEEARLEQRIVDLQKRIDEDERLRVAIKDLERRHSIQKQLATDLGGPAFQEFLLRETFRDIVDGASLRLKNLSGRYGLDMDDNSFAVIDYDNAGERRSADTLSGGETFLASLALALELSEQVRRSAGAVDLDSLFIDEGFGTLDPETLDTVASAVESLQVGGRMVGVITHLPELTARFPVQLHVSKGTDSARIEVRYA